MEVQKAGLLFCLVVLSVFPRGRTERTAAEDCMHCTGEDYRGKISTTINGHTCQRWDSQKPHQHHFKPSTLPGKYLEENYCRNPDGQPIPWCYTTNPSVNWEYCSIPLCTTEPPTIVPEFTCANGNGKFYRGTISVTESGKTCQNWASQTPHSHSRFAENYPCKGLEGNYCRNPDESSRPWCYTTDPDTRWEYCNVPSCGIQPIPECMHCSGEDYRGKIATTESGYVCQHWDSQKPHKHNYDLSTLHKKNLEKNYCRNPDGSPRPWCFTRNPSILWGFCSIPKCKTELPTIVPEHTCITENGSSYRGTVSVTESGKTCQNWASQIPHKHSRMAENYPCKGLTGNYCRNPDNEKRPWCYTTDPETRWEYCNVPRCGDYSKPAVDDCMHCTGEDYRGKISTTDKGYTCQRWDSQKPHNHVYIPFLLPEKHLEKNYCRNPDGQPRPWCFTTNPSKRWEYCSIPECEMEPPTIEPELSCITGDGSSYRGIISVTVSGKTCQTWTSQTPHKHFTTPWNYRCKDLQDNYCRNPDNRIGPWCHTTDPETPWEYCNVAICGDQVDADDCMHCTGEDYRGKINTTERGYPCKRWDSQTLSNEHYNNLSEDYLEKNYCRNPNGRQRPWCFTTNPSSLWEYCSIPRCATEPPVTVPELTCATGKGKSYRGTISVTESGRTCQNWSSARPHLHFMNPKDYPCKGLEANYCRNPENEKRPWCYTTDPETRWEYCNIPRCGSS